MTRFKGSDLSNFDFRFKTNRFCLKDLPKTRMLKILYSFRNYNQKHSLAL